MSTIIATGYKAIVGYKSESTYGVPPENTTYNWVGSIQNITVRGELNPIAVYEVGGTRFPNYIVQGERAVSVDLTFYPQGTTFLSELFTNGHTNSYSFVINFPDISQNMTVFGSKVERITVRGTRGNPLEVTCTFQAQNLSASLPTNVTLPTEPNLTPYYFANINIKKDTTVQPKVLEFSIDLTNRLERVYRFGQFWVRTIPTLTAEIAGRLVVTFENADELNQLLSFTDSTISLDLGGTNTLSVNNAIFESIETPVRPDALVALTVPFIGKGVTFT